MKPQRILIADDDEKVLALLKSSLQKSGYETSLAVNGVEALKLAQKETPDLILADIAMPEMDGFELCKLIRDDPVTSHIPFIFLTAKGELSDKVTGLNLGADDYISKPFHISEVTARIKAILQRFMFLSQQSTEAEESDLKGNLEQMQLAEVIQTLSMNQKSGGLRIVNSSQQVGKIYFDTGTIVDAVIDNYQGEEAVYRILIWEEGYFEFDSKDTSKRPTITASLNSLLMKGFDQREEYFKYKKVMPPFSYALKIVTTSIPQEINKPATQKILEFIDGQNTIEDIIRKSPGNYLFAVKILYTLLKKEVIEAKDLDLFKQPEEKDFGQLAHELYE